LVATSGGRGDQHWQDRGSGHGEHRRGADAAPGGPPDARTRRRGACGLRGQWQDPGDHQPGHGGTADCCGRRSGNGHRGGGCVPAPASPPGTGPRAVLMVYVARLAVACLDIFTSGPTDQPLDDARDLPEASPPTGAVRAKRALRSAPVVLVRGIGMPAYAETGASVIEHGLRMLPVRSGRDAGDLAKAP
jgi:hypothetical protein